MHDVLKLFLWTNYKPELALLDVLPDRVERGLSVDFELGAREPGNLHDHVHRLSKASFHYSKTHEIG